MKQSWLSIGRPPYVGAKLWWPIVVAALLSACASTPPTGLTMAQKQALAANGFVETTRGWELTMADRVLFATDDSALQPEQVANIAKLGATLAQIGIASARVEGHTDNSGTESHNSRLSLARAQSVATPLRSAGIQLAADHISGRGEAFPIGDNQTVDGRADNRRVVIIVTP